MSEKIIQIMPAVGWFAVLRMSDEPFYYLDPLVGWALIEETEDGESYGFVTGLIASDWVTQLNDNNQFYVYTNGDISDVDRAHWTAEGRKWAEAQAEKEAKRLAPKT